MEEELFMRFKTITAAVALTAAAFATPAMAQDVGATIMGNDGNPVGTITARDDTTVVLDTGAHQVPLGPDMFAQVDGNWSINTTKTELDAMMDEMKAQQQAALAAALVEGAAVVTADAQPLGTIETIEAEAIVLTYEEAPLTLPKDLFALDGNGAVMVLAELSAIKAALEAAATAS